MFSIINTGLTSSQRDLSVTANNLANSNTVGFKKSKSNFVDIFANDPTSNPKTAVGSGTMTATVDKDMSQGSMTSTGRVTDLAIAGKGFFTLGALGSQPKPLIVPTFSGLGLTPASWPALPQPTAYKALDPVTGSGLTLFETSTHQTPSFPIFDGKGLPTATNKQPTTPALNLNFEYITKNPTSSGGITGAFPAFSITSPDNGEQDVWNAYYSSNAGNSVTFDWSYVTQDRDGASFDKAGYFIIPKTSKNLDDAVLTQLSNDFWPKGESHNGTVTATFSGDESFGWYVQANDGALGPSTLSITNASFSSNNIEGPTRNYHLESTNWTTDEYRGTSSNVFYVPEGNGSGSFSGFSGRKDYISFGADGFAGSRFFTMDNLDLRGVNSISYDLIAGTNLNGGEASEVGENFSIAYSKDGGKTFTPLKNHNANDLGVSAWKQYTCDLPSEAQTDQIILRFDQNGSSGSGYDHWGLTNIAFVTKSPEPQTAMNSNPIYSWNEGNQKGIAENVFWRNNGLGAATDGGFSSDNNYIFFGGGVSAGKRSITVEDLDLTHVKSISMSAISGTNQNGGEITDGNLENLKLFFSLDDGKTYNLVKTFEPPISAWQNYIVDLPQGSKTKNVTLKFEQEGSSGPNYDHWGLKDIQFINDTPPPIPEPPTINNNDGTFYEWSLGLWKGSAQNVFISNQGLGIGNNTPFNGRQPYVTFGGGGVAGQRILTYPPLDLRSKSSIQLDVIAGSNTNGGDTSNTGELLYIEYSTDGGKSFKQLANFENSDGSMNNWSAKSITLPKEANAENVQIRFRQEGSSGPQYDHWGLANISFVDKVLPNSGGDARVYTRAGNFSLDKEGYLTSSSGLRVLGTNVSTKNELEAVQILSTYNGSPLAGVDINSAGRITATYGDGTVRELYDLAIASFDNDSALKQIGNTQFTTTGESGTAKYLPAGKGGGTIMAATLEQSNTDITGELMNMLRTQQNYNANARMLQAYVEVASRLTDKI